MEPRHLFQYESLTAVRYNPLGLSSRLALSWRLNLAPNTDKTLSKGTHLSVSVVPEVSPAIGRLGLEVVFNPLAIVEFQALYESVNYPGTFGHLQFFESARDDYRPQTLEERANQGRNRAASQWMWTVSTRLQARVGPIAARSRLSAYRIDIDLRDKERTFYEPTLDIMAPVGGWTAGTDTDLLYLSDSGLILGIRHSWLRPFYTARHVRPGESPDIHDRGQHRIGPLLAYQLSDRPGEAVSGQTVFALFNWWLQHNYRTGEVTSRAVPYIAVGYAVDGVFWP